MAYDSNPAETKKEKTWIECVDLHLESLRIQRMAETGRDGTTIAEAHADLYQRGRGAFERLYDPNGNNEDIYAYIAKRISSKPLFSPRVLISASDTAIVEKKMKNIPLEDAIGHQTKMFGLRTRVFLKAITPQRPE